MPQYNIYPSLLNGYQSLLDYRIVAEEGWNRQGDEYKLTPEQMYLKLEADLIDSINRVEHAPCEAADKGTAFNEVVDCLIEFRGSSREDCRIYSVKDRGVVRAEINGFVFDFDLDLCCEVADVFKGSLTQYPASADMETSRGMVHLYGYIDEWVGDRMADLKTTGRYDFGKFERGWQRHLYPWCVVASGHATEVRTFTYYVVKWAKSAEGEPLKAAGIYEETYDYDHEDSGRRLREIVESFIDWLESRREFIQDRKIFGGENPQGWHGTPVDVGRLMGYIFPDMLNIFDNL